MSADGSVQKNELNEKSSGCEQQLHALRDGALGALVDVFDLLNGIRKQGEMVIDAADYVATADGTLADLQNKLDHLAALAVEQLGPAYRGGNERLTIFQASYTMAAERDVHNSIASNGIAAARL